MLNFDTFKLLVLGAAIAAGAGLKAQNASAEDRQVITVAGGCFWCVEADFEKVRGVSEVISGYTGGAVNNPTYRQVTGGGTGHYEAVQIHFDAELVSASQLYYLFFRSIDPFDADGQFCDRGDSYRTAIFVSDQNDLEAAQSAKAQAQGELGQAIVTPILQASDFFEAEGYHQDYYKGARRVITRAGVMTQAESYRFYRNACGRDRRVEEIWGADAPFIP